MHTVPSAIQAVKAFKDAKFDESMDVHARVDGRVRGTFVFPCGLGKPRRVICFATGDDALLAEQAGATDVGSSDLAEKVKNGSVKYDVVVAHPNTMRYLAPLGKFLKGKMPSPSSGTLTENVAQSVKEFRDSRVNYRSDDEGFVHTTFGRKSFSQVDLYDNLKLFLQSLGEQAEVESVSISATMSPSIKIDQF